jgi:hypothetical protein
MGILEAISAPVLAKALNLPNLIRESDCVEAIATITTPQTQGL